MKEYSKLDFIQFLEGNISICRNKIQQYQEALINIQNQPNDIKVIVLDEPDYEDQCINYRFKI